MKLFLYKPLAIVAFTSPANYQVAKLGVSTPASGQEIFVSGWPAPGYIGTHASGQATGRVQVIRQFTYGRISGFLDTPVSGYQMSYTNVTRGGMSGGPVFDAGGRVIGIHGLGDTETPERLMSVGLSEDAANSLAGLIKPGFNYAIPISTYLRQAPAAGIYLNTQVDASPTPQLGQPYVADASPDSRDVITDYTDVLNTFDRTLDAIDNGARTVCRLFGC